MMLIGDGVTPGNEARGYVLRRLLRRAVRSMRLLGVEDRALPELLPVSRDKMAMSYPELDARLGADLHGRVRRGGRVPADAARRHHDLRHCAAQEAKAGGPDRSCPASKAFALHDTYGFPIDLTLEMAAEQGLSVDEEGFRRLMTEQRERAKADARAKKGAARRRQRPTGRSRTPWARRSSSPATPRWSPRRPCAASWTRRAWSIAAREGDEVELVLDRTPFYAEGGGQLADQGVIELGNGARLEVLDVQSPITGLIVHQVEGARR